MEELSLKKLNYLKNISQELFTPLTIITDLIDDLEKQSCKNKFQLSVIRSNLDRLNNKLQQVLEFPDKEHDDIQLCYEPIELHNRKIEMVSNKNKVSEFSLHNSTDKSEISNISFPNAIKSNMLLNLDYNIIDQHFISNAINIVEGNLSESEFDVNLLAKKLNISKSSLYRKIKTITGLSPVEFVRNIKLKQASILLRMNKTALITDIAYAVGFSDPRYFSSCFKAKFNMTPSDYVRMVP